jgi:hypothetical protein
MFYRWMIVIIRGTYQRFPSLAARTRSCSCGRSARPRCWRASWGSGLRGASGWRSGWPTRRRWDSTGSAGLDKRRWTVEADPAVVVDVGVEHLGEEFDLGRFGRILLGEFESEFEQSAFPRGTLGPLDEGRPFEQVALLGRGVDALVVLVAHLLKVADKALLSWGRHLINANIYNRRVIAYRTD